MKTLLVTGLLLASTAAFARPDSTSMTCAEAKNLVASHGAIVIGTGPNLYDRYVAHQGYCTTGEFAEPAWIKTSDMDQCMVGYTCEQGNQGDN